jgi:hypothetical protein
MAARPLETLPQLRKLIERLPVASPLTNKFEAARAERGPARRDVWYSSQKQHWLGWLGGYDGPGVYARKKWDRSAAYVYNHVVCPPMLFWLAEAAGVAKETLSRAEDEALAARPVMPAQCAAIRREIARLESSIQEEIKVEAAGTRSQMLVLHEELLARIKIFKRIKRKL